MKLNTKIIILLLLAAGATGYAQKVSIRAKNEPAEKVFATLMEHSGKNFIYPAGLLRTVRVSIYADNRPLTGVLDEMLKGSGIGYRIRGNNVMLFRKPTPKPKEPKPIVKPKLSVTAIPDTSRMLEELTVIGNPNADRAINSAEIGSMNVNRSSVLNTPVVFGESDIIKTLQLEPGVSAGVEGMAGMYVHGGNTDENMYMLDNIPLYQVNHLGGLFSAFNTEALHNVDFYKSTFPARYDGRLSSFMDVTTKEGSMKEHHGGVKIGLTSAAVNVDGPIWKGHTSYSVAARRSWYDLLTIPICTILNSRNKQDHSMFGYAFTDLNAKITHRFSERSRAYATFYYGEDYFHAKQDSHYSNDEYDTDRNNMRWGNLMASVCWHYDFNSKLSADLTGAFTRYASRLMHSEESGIETGGNKIAEIFDKTLSRNNIHDWIIKTDFDWNPNVALRFNFGAGYTRHSYLPSFTSREVVNGEFSTSLEDNSASYHANELNLYGSGDWAVSVPFRVSYGLHYSLFSIDGKTHHNLSPRLSFRWQPAPGWAVKGGYSRAVQYVHQLQQTSISLPTDQWVPIVGDQIPQTADKIALGAYWSLNNEYTFSIEGYWKWMHNLLDYADNHYLLPPDTDWEKVLTAGKGTAKGIDFKITKDYGKVTAQIAYSLLWTDRQFEGKNGGRRFPARFDNRHKINLMVNWKISPKWEVGASWTGMSGNRITLPLQLWQDPLLAPWHYEMPLPVEENNYRLPFYHRMDLNFRRNTRHGYWDFSLYNAYCNMNTITVIRDYSDDFSTPGDNPWYPGMDLWTQKPTFKKVRLIPIIPSVSYTWLF